MRLSLRLILFLVAGITLVTLLVARNEVRSEKRGLRTELETQMYVYFLPLHSHFTMAGVLAIFHDASYIEAQSVRIWRETLWHVIAQVLLIVLITVLIIRWTIILPISRTAQWVKDLRIGRTKFRPSAPKEEPVSSAASPVANFTRAIR